RCEKEHLASSAPKSIRRCRANPFPALRYRCVAFRATPFVCLCTPSSGCIDIPWAEPRVAGSCRTARAYGTRCRFVPSSRLLVRLRRRQVQTLRSEPQEGGGNSSQLRGRVVPPNETVTGAPNWRSPSRSRNAARPGGDWRLQVKAIPPEQLE